jgi:hypothetical protein
MAYTVGSSFNQFYDVINLGGDHRETANTRKNRIVELLGKHFTILEAFGTGSIPKFTALKGHADLDIIVALHYGNHIKDKTPTQVLQSVRDVLAEYRTGARKNGQAVTLYYETWPNVDIVPVSQSTDNNGTITHYNVPDSNTDTWIQSRPKKHAADIEQKSTDCGSNFRKIIKMIKWWNRSHSNYLQSYHIEILAMKVFNSNIDDTEWNVFQFFEKSRLLLQSSLWHDTGYVDGYLSYYDRQEVLKRVDTAIEKTRLAWSCTYGDKNDHQTAIGIWRQVFGDKFPSYG